MPPFDPTCDHVLLSVDEMGRADRLAEKGGVPSTDLMEAAGRTVAGASLQRTDAGQAVILAGPGNNGGDGFVAARYLVEAGLGVTVALLGGPDKLGDLKGDAAWAAERYTGPVCGLDPAVLEGVDLIVDALFGAGLSRPIEGEVAKMVAAANAASAFRTAVDVPSGIEGDTGQPSGEAFRADLTVTFFRKKPGHVLMPGRLFCGETVVRDIGIPVRVLRDIAPRTWVNSPDLWIDAWPPLDPTGHKYSRGHAIVAGARPPALGASRMVALAALRAGAGLVTLATPQSGYEVQAGALMEVIVFPLAEQADFAALLKDERKNAVALGPGNKADEETAERVRMSLKAGKACVLDADALTAFADDPNDLFKIVGKGAPAVMTPHPGEFERLFGSDPDKLSATRKAASVSGATILQKGADTVIAAPDGRAVIEARPCPHLATAGAGDVLTGVVLGCLAEAMGAFEAACCAQWLHLDAAGARGRGMIAGDIIASLPGALGRLEGLRSR